MSVATAPRPLAFAGVPAASWAFAIRIWIAIVVALYAGFWLQLEAASSAAITVGVLALPTRGPALEKAGFRLFATIIGVVAAIALVGIFSQARDLLLLAFAAWVGLCIYAAGLSDGNRAYAAVLCGYTVALVAIQQIDTPFNVFDAGVQRGAAIALGIAAIAFVNDLLVAPDRHVGVTAELAAYGDRVRALAKATIGGEATNGASTAELLRGIAALRAEITSLAAESSVGALRSAAARSTAVALVAEIHALHILKALPAIADPALRERLASALEEGRDEQGRDGRDAAPHWASRQLLRRDRQVREGLAALRSGTRPARVWRTPFYVCHRLSAAVGLRATLWLALASAFFVLAGWPSADLSLALVAVLIGLGAMTPDPRKFTVVALIATPIAVVLAGVLEFLILDGVTQFPLLALGLAPFVIGTSVLMTLPNQLLASIGRLSLIFVLAILSPANPQTYDAQAFLFASLFVVLAAALLFAAQLLIPPLSDEHRRQALIGAARREFRRLPSCRAEPLAPEEAMFRDAVRIGQIGGTGIVDAPHRAVFEEALALFDRAGLLRLCEDALCRLGGGPSAELADAARGALIARDASLVRRAAEHLREAATADALAASEILLVTSLVMDAK